MGSLRCGLGFFLNANSLCETEAKGFTCLRWCHCSRHKKYFLPASALFRISQQPPTPQAVHEDFREKHENYVNICPCISVCVCLWVCERERESERGYGNKEPIWHMGSQHPSSLCLQQSGLGIKHSDLHVHFNFIYCTDLIFVIAF